MTCTPIEHLTKTYKTNNSPHCVNKHPPLGLLAMGLATSNQYSFHKYKNHFYKMKRDIGMADYEKLVKQEFHTPSLYLCFFIIGAEQDAAEQSGFMEDS